MAGEENWGGRREGGKGTRTEDPEAGEGLGGLDHAVEGLG